MRKVTIVLGVVVAGLVALVAFLLLSPDSANLFRGTQSVTDQAAMDEAARVFVRNPYKDDYGVLRIPGYVDNLGAYDIASISIEVQLYAGEDKKELVEYTIENVDKGARKSFDANAGTIAEARTAQVRIVALEVYK